MLLPDGGGSILLKPTDASASTLVFDGRGTTNEFGELMRDLGIHRLVLYSK